jgi:hypothetical protein
LTDENVSFSKLLGDGTMKCELFEGLSSVAVALFFCGVLIMPATIVGCAQKETVLDVETPRSEVEVERDRETGDVDVEVNRDAPAATPQP